MSRALQRCSGRVQEVDYVKQKMQKHINLTIFLVVLLTVCISVPIAYFLGLSNATVYTVIKEPIYVNPTVTVFKVGSTYYAINSLTGVNYSSVDAITVIQNAIDDLAKTGGGVVLLRSGIYTISKPIIIKSNIWLKGEGPHNTILTPSEKFSGSGQLAIIKNEHYETIPADGNITITGLGINGKKILCGSRRIGGINIHGSTMSTPDFYVENVRIDNLYICDMSADGLNYRCVKDSFITNMKVERCGTTNLDHGVYLKRVRNMFLSNIHVYETTGMRAFKIDSEVYDLQMQNCKAEKSKDHGLRLADVTRATISNFISIDNGGMGAWITDSKQLVISGIFAYNQLSQIEFRNVNDTRLDVICINKTRIRRE